MKQKLVSFLIALLASMGIAFAQSGPVACYGELMVNASTGKIYGSLTGATKPVQVKGVSFGWNMYAQESGKYYTTNMVNAMVNSMKAEIVRVPMSTKSDDWNNAYDKNPTGLTNLSNIVIDAALANGVYVIIDWHSHQAETEKANAIKYFGEMAQKYGKYDNVIFEIYNEPLGQDWNTIRSYAVDVIDEIRKHSDNLILVGTQGFSQMIGAPADNKINVPNVAYVLHFYAYSHQMNTYTAYGNSQFNVQITKALNAKLPIFVSEWGTTHSDGGQQSAGNFNTHSAANSNTWMKWCDDNNISWCAWEVSDKSGAKSAWFEASKKSPSSSTIAKTDLNESGQYIWDQLATHATKASWRQPGGCAACTEAIVTLNLNYTGAPAATTQKACVGSPAVKPVDPKRAGYRFLGWTTTITGTNYYPFTANLTGALTLYAQWELGGGPTMLADCETDFSNRCTPWWGYADVDGSTITSANGLDDDGNFAITPTGGQGGGGHMTVTYTKVAAGWGCGFGFNINPLSTEDKLPVDLTGATAISFYHKGDAGSIQLSVLGAPQTFDAPIAAHANWTLVTVEMETFAYAYSDAITGTVAGTLMSATDIQNVASIQFQLGTTKTNGSFGVDNIELQGLELEPCDEVIPVDPCETLAALILEAEALNAATLVGINPGNCTQAGKNAFTIAIATANTVCPSVDEDVVKTATAQLRADILAFRATIVPSDNNTVIADCEDGNLTKLQSYWSSFASSNTEGETPTIVPASDGDNPFEMIGAGKEGSYSASVSGKLTTTGDPGYSTAGIGFPFVEPATPGGAPIAYNLTGATGIGFWHKGDGVTFSVMITTVTPDGGFDYQITVPSSVDWQYVVASFPGETPEVTGDFEAALAQVCGTWGPPGVAELRDWDASLAYKLQWQVKDGANNRNYQFAIDEVKVLGLVLDLEFVNTLPLETAIAKAETILSNATPGTAPGNYPAAAITDFGKAINDAKAALLTVKDNDEVAAAVTALEKAMQDFADARVPLPNTIVADCEDGGKTKFGTYWYALNDNGEGGTSISAPEAGEDFTMTANGANGTANYAGLTYTLGKGTLGYNPFVGMGFALAEPKAPYTTEDGRDLSEAEGVTFWYKGDQSRFKAATSDVTNSNNYNVLVGPYADWTKVTITWDMLTQEDWGDDTQPVPFNPENILEFQWQAQGADGTTGDFGVDQFQIDGMFIQFQEPGLALDNNVYNEQGGADGEYQIKDNRYATYALGVKDKLTITIAGTSQYDIADFKVSIVDTRNDGWIEKSDYVTLGAIEAGTPFSFTKSVTVTEAALAGQYSIVFSGISTTALAAGVDPLVLKLEGADFDEYTVTYEENLEGVYEFCYNADPEVELNRGTFSIPGFDTPVKAGDVVRVTMKGTTEQSVDLTAWLVDETENADYWTDLAEWPGVAVGEITPGVEFDLTFDIPIVTAPATPFGEKSQNIVFLDWTSAGICTKLTLDVFTAEIVAPEFDTEALDNAIAKAITYAAEDACIAGGKYPASAIADIAEALEAAQGIRTTATSQEEIDQAEEDLTAAITVFEATEITTVKNDLAAKINEAKDALIGAVEGNADGNYKAGAIGTLTDAIEAAEDVNGNPCALQPAVNDAVSALDGAIKDFEKEKISIDKTALENAITEAEELRDNNILKIGEGDGMYPQEEWNALDGAIGIARTELTNAASTDASVAQTVSDLKDAMDKFNASVLSVDKTELEAAISDVQTIFDNAKTAGGNGHYPAGEKIKLNTALTAANNVYENAKASQTEVNKAIEDLEEAKKEFLLTVITVEKGDLETLITTAEGLAGSAIIGTEAGEYLQAVKDAFDTAIAEAILVYDNEDATQEAVNTAIENLQEAIDDEFKANPLVTAPLEQAIARAENLRNAATTVIGDAEGEYPQTAADVFDSAIAAAIDTLGKATTNAAIIAAAAELDGARIAFINSVNGINKQPLEDAIAAAEDIFDNAVVGEGEGEYPQTAKDVLEQAILDAEAALANAVSQSDITDALTALEKAVDDFEKAANVIIIDTSELATLLEEAHNKFDTAVKGNGNGQYSAEIYDALNDAIARAEQAVANPTSQAQVNNRKTALQTALDAFIANEVDKQLLLNLITDAQSLHDAADDECEINGCYEAGSKSILQVAIDDATDVYNNAGASTDDVAMAIDDLQNAMDVFDGKQISFGNGDLLALIAEANEMLGDAEEGTGHGYYLAEKIEAFGNKIADAQTVADNGAATQVDIKMAESALKTAMAAFTPEVVLSNDLATLLVDAIEAYEDAEFGVLEGQYPVAIGTDLATAMEEAQKVLDDPQSTQAQVNAAYDTLNTAFNALKNAETNEMDKTALIQAIADAQDTLVGAVEGEEFGNYLAGAINALEGEITLAESILNSNVEQSVIDDATDRLNGAIADFNAKQIKVDKSDLKDAIEAAKARVTEVEDNNLIGNGNGQFTQASVNTLNGAIATAQAVVDASGITQTQAQIDAAEEAIRQALIDFNDSEIEISKTALYNALEDAHTTIAPAEQQTQGCEGNGMYPQAAITAYQNVIALAQAEYDKPNSTLNAIQAQLSALASAKVTFEASKIKVETNALSTSIQTAENALQGIAIGCEYNNCYPADVTAALQNELIAAENVLVDVCATQENVNDAKIALDNALKAFIDGQIIVDKNDLTSAITVAQDVYDFARPGENPGQYPQEAIDAYYIAIQAANQVNANDYATQDEVDDALEALNEASKSFNDAMVPEIGTETEDLQALINEATQLLQGAKEESEGGVYIDGSKSDLQDVMLDARVALDAETQEKVDDAAEALQKAIDEFMNSVAPGKLDKQPLTKTIAEADGLVRKAEVGIEPGQYSQQAVDALAEEMALAQAVLASATTQAELNEAYHNLRNAIAAFEAEQVPYDFDARALKLLIKTVQVDSDNAQIKFMPSQEGYPTSAVIKIKKDKATAEAALAKATSQQDVDKAYADLYAAYQTFLQSWELPTDIDVVEASELRVYPTIATANVNVVAAKTINTITIVSLTGATVVLETPYSTQATIDITTLPQGNYTIVVTFDDNSVETKGFIKK